MTNPQPDETDLGVYQSVDIGNGLILQQYTASSLDIIAGNGSDRQTCHATSRDEAQKLITALQRWLDTGGFYAPESNNPFTHVRRYEGDPQDKPLSPGDCDCWHCQTHFAEMGEPYVVRVPCPLCHSDKCAHTADHRNPCSGRNDTEQPLAEYP